MKLTLRKAKILPDEKEKGKKKNPNKKSNRKKSVPSALKTISTSSVIYTAAVGITTAERQLQPVQDCMCRQSLIPLWIITEPNLRRSAV